jgi:DNA-binding transcriptional LysR family regulator
MTLEDLRTFVAVCERGSLSAAAQSLNKSQPGASQHIKRLEQELDMPLLERRARGVVPTAAGRVLYEAATAALSELGLARSRLSALRAGTGGSLSIVTGGTTLKHFMAGALMRFRRRHPKVAVRFRQGHSTAHCIEALHKHGLDLGFVTMQSAVRGIEQRPLLLMEHALLVRAGHRLARRKRLGLETLGTLRLIGLSPQSAAFASLRGELSARGITPKTTTSVDDWDLAHVLVGLGFGSAIVPAFHAYEFVRDGSVAAIPIDGLEPLQFGWAARRFASLSGAALSFMDVVEQELRSVERPGVRVLSEAKS